LQRDRFFGHYAMLMNGAPYARVTHVAFTVPLLGRAQVTITEMLLTQDMLTQAQ
jgi:hypothetical protein